MGTSLESSQGEGVEDGAGSSKRLESEVSQGLVGDERSSKGMDDQQEKQRNKDDALAYTKIVTNGITKFKCNSCDKVCGSSKQMKTHNTKTHTKKDKNVTEKTPSKENTIKEMNKKMYEQYGTGEISISNLPSIEVILNYGKDNKEGDVANQTENEKEAGVMEVDKSMEEENKMLKTEIEGMKT